MSELNEKCAAQAGKSIDEKTLSEVTGGASFDIFTKRKKEIQEAKASVADPIGKIPDLPVI